MKKHVLLIDLLAAASFAVLAPILFRVFHIFCWGSTALYLLIALGVPVYVLTLMVARGLQTGYFVGLGFVVCAQLLMFMAQPAFAIYVCGSLLVLWFSRFLVLRYSILRGLLDVLLILISAMTAFVVLAWTRSIGLGVWTFLFLLAVFAFIQKGRSLNPLLGRPCTRFDEAFRSAERALGIIAERNRDGTIA